MYIYWHTYSDGLTSHPIDRPVNIFQTRQSNQNGISRKTNVHRTMNIFHEYCTKQK